VCFGVPFAAVAAAAFTPAAAAVWAAAALAAGGLGAYALGVYRLAGREPLRGYRDQAAAAVRRRLGRRV
jgi:hypothetical protein